MSHEVRVLHRHVVALLYHRSFVIDVGARTYDGLSLSNVVYAVEPLCLEPLLTRIKHNLVLNVLAPWLIKRFWSVGCFQLLLVNTRSWDFTLVVVLIEHLVVIESG